MEMSVDALQGGITRIRLAGRMDFEASAEIDEAFMASARAAQALLIDLSKVTFLGSMGIRAFISAAKAVRGRGGKMVLFRPELDVTKVLTTCGTDTLIPIYYDLALARRALR